MNLLYLDLLQWRWLSQSEIESVMSTKIQSISSSGKSRMRWNSRNGQNQFVDIAFTTLCLKLVKCLDLIHLLFLYYV